MFLLLCGEESMDIFINTIITPITTFSLSFVSEETWSELESHVLPLSELHSRQKLAVKA